MCVFVCVFCKSEQKHKPLHDIAFHGWQIIYLCATLHCTTSIQTTCIICMKTKYTLFVHCTYIMENLENATHLPHMKHFNKNKCIAICFSPLSYILFIPVCQTYTIMHFVYTLPQPHSLSLNQIDLHTDTMLFHTYTKHS